MIARGVPQVPGQTFHRIHCHSEQLIEIEISKLNKKNSKFLYTHLWYYGYTQTIKRIKYLLFRNCDKCLTIS